MGYDLFIIGAGPGGYETALAAAAMGKKVGIAEERELGGTCLNRGCIPTKALLKSARLYADALLRAGEYGVRVETPKADLKSMLAHAAAVEDELRRGIEGRLIKAGVDIYPVRASVAAPGRVIAGGKEIEADHILLATGSSPMKLPIPGADREGVYYSDDLLTGNGVDCQSIVIIGGGVVGAEIAQFYADLGRSVTVIEALERLLPRMEKELGQSLASSFKKRGIRVLTGARVEEIGKAADGRLQLTVTQKDQTIAVEGDAVLLAAGRSPNTVGLLPEELSGLLERGYVRADADGATAVSGLYAAGDIVLGSAQLAHTAVYQGKRALRRMFKAEAPAAQALVPYCVFTSPEIASIGLTQEEAKKQGIAVTVKKSLTSLNGRSLVEGAERGFAKLVFGTEDRRLLGAQLFCTHASEMIGALGALIARGADMDTFMETIWPHPTISEVLAL